MGKVKCRANHFASRVIHCTVDLHKARIIHTHANTVQVQLLDGLSGDLIHCRDENCAGL